MPSFRQCKNIYNRMKKMLKGFDEMITFNGSNYTVTFWNGSVIQFITADNDNCRGFTFDAMIIDEANFVKDSMWQEAIQPTIAAALSKKNDDGLVGYYGKVLLTSTPKAKNWFYGIVSDEDDDRTIVTRFTSEEGGIISKDYLDRVKKKIPDSVWRNEYMGEFLDSGNGLFKYLECVSNIECKSGSVAALDVASKNDYMSLTIQNKDGNVIYQNRWRHQEYEVLLNTVTKILNDYGKPTCFVETNGIGQVPFEILRKKYGKVKEWVTTNKSKNEIIQKLMVDFNTKNITILDIDYVKDELDNFTCEWKSGKATYGGSNGFHDDTVMSLAICNYNRNKVKTIKPVYIKTNNKRSL